MSREWNQAALAQIGAAHVAVQLNSVEGDDDAATSSRWRMQAVTLARDDAASNLGLTRLLAAASRWRSELRALSLPPHLLPVLPSCVSTNLEVLDLSASGRRVSKSAWCAAASATPPGCASSA